MDPIEAMDRTVLNAYIAVPKQYEDDWISVLRQFGILNAQCQDMGIPLDICTDWQTGFQRNALRQDGPCVCVALMDEADFTESERAAGIDLLKREGVACVIALLKSESVDVAHCEIDGSGLHIFHYAEPSDIRITGLTVIQKLLKELALPEEETDEDGRAKEIQPGLIAASGPEPYELMLTRPDVIVALDSLPNDIWDHRFTGDILYYPITPWGVLDYFILERLVVEIDGLLEDRKRVALFSMDGCGRVGYVAACVLYQRGIRKPIEWLRQNWEASALSAELQEQNVRQFCSRHGARTYFHCVHLSRHVQIDSIDTFEADEALQREISRVREGLGEHSRIDFRFSALLPSVRILVETQNILRCRDAIDELVRVIQQTGHYAGIVWDW